MLREVGFTASAQAFIDELSELRNIVFERLLTTPLEVLQRKEFVDDVNSNTAKINTAIENMINEMNDAVADAEQKVFIMTFLLSLTLTV